jgi:hypothetical protein
MHTNIKFYRKQQPMIKGMNLILSLWKVHRCRHIDGEIVQKFS